MVVMGQFEVIVVKKKYGNAKEKTSSLLNIHYTLYS